MSNDSLANVANTMRARLGTTADGWLLHVLGRSLAIVLDRKADAWRLALGRATIFPSVKEIEICRAAFGVPEGAAMAWLEPGMGQRSARFAQYWVVELRWVERVEEVSGD